MSTGAAAHVAVVTRHFGGTPDEPAGLARLVAGALARHARVSVVHLVDALGAGEEQSVDDSVFRVHRELVGGARPLWGGIARVALVGAGVRAPARGGAALLERLAGEAPGVAARLGALAPDAVVLVGCDQPFDLTAALGARGRGPRVTLIPLLGANRPDEVPRAEALCARADAIASVHPGEHAALVDALGERGGDVVALDLALPLNRGAAHHRLFGVRWFGRYVVLLRAFPGGGPRHYRGPTHEYVRQVLGRVAVAEVDDGRWRITDGEHHLLLPVNPTRVNLWRLMEHAVATIDLRPPGPIGREALESMLLRTPAVVPEGSAAHAHVAAASGGLWYQDIGECLDATRILLDRPLRDRLGAQGEAYAAAHHGDSASFVRRVAELVLGTTAT